jgi:hypothetical protein
MHGDAKASLVLTGYGCRHAGASIGNEGTGMNRLIYIVGLVVVILFVLAFFGLR